MSAVLAATMPAGRKLSSAALRHAEARPRPRNSGGVAMRHQRVFSPSRVAITAATGRPAMDATTLCSGRTESASSASVVARRPTYGAVTCSITSPDGRRYSAKEASIKLATSAAISRW